MKSPFTRPLMRRATLGLVAAACLLITGCATGGRLGTTSAPTPVQEQRQAAAEFARLVESGAPAKQVAVLEGGNPTIAVLKTRRAGAETYVTPDGVTLRMRDGLLTGTAGLGNDIQNSDLAQVSALLRSRNGGVAERFQTFLTGEYRAVTRTYLCTISPQGPAEIDLATRDGQLRKVKTRLMQEDCRSLDQTFRNFYWLRGDRIVQSRQWAGAVSGMLVLRDLVN
ncbi:YjbF family lipoprotein [Vannielia sp.]|uniref:YjbF family lipoprotein n=1 Tax=Vannielia sp. TaxID=2813045 RepID=UPI00260436C2|nr:YjbF family lipoprotein [Vannielia sp.]MDF1871131.1 YjbF family lipoprotein [Vannielia sp.]